MESDRVVPLGLNRSSSSTCLSFTGEDLRAEVDLAGFDGSLTASAAASGFSAGLRSGISAFSSETVRLRVARVFWVMEAARVVLVVFAFSSSVGLEPLVRTLETCVIFLGDRGAWVVGVLARVCLVGRAANADLGLAAGAFCVSCCAPTAFGDAGRFGCAAALVVLVVRVGSGSTVSFRFDRVARVAVDLGSSASSSAWSGCALSSSRSGSGFLDRVVIAFGAVETAFAVDAAVARLTGLLRNVRLASCFFGSSVCPVRAPRRVATMFAV